MRFSERHGYSESKELQIEEIDDELETRLWNAFERGLWKPARDARNSYGTEPARSLSRLVEILIEDFFIHDATTLRSTRFESRIEYIRDQYYALPWFKKYELIEEILKYREIPNLAEYIGNFIKRCNLALEKENAAFRLIDGNVVKVTDEQEINAIEEALASAEPYHGVREHLRAALQLMSDRDNPDYRNSIKESISAVESLCQELTGNNDATLGDALTALQRDTDIELHGALKAAYSSIYGYSSNADGIRHAMLKKSNVTHADAKYMLVSCTAFVNYLISKKAEQS